MVWLLASGIDYGDHLTSSPFLDEIRLGKENTVQAQTVLDRLARLSCVSDLLKKQKTAGGLLYFGLLRPKSSA